MMISKDDNTHHQQQQQHHHLYHHNNNQSLHHQQFLFAQTAESYTTSELPGRGTGNANQAADSQQQNKESAIVIKKSMSQQQIEDNENENSQSLSAQQKSSKTQGRWTKQEHAKFIEGIKKFGRNWKKVEDHIGTRTGAQIRSHAQKYFNRLEKEKKGILPLSESSKEILEIISLPERDLAQSISNSILPVSAAATTITTTTSAMPSISISAAPPMTITNNSLNPYEKRDYYHHDLHANMLLPPSNDMHQITLGHAPQFMSSAHQQESQQFGGRDGHLRKEDEHNSLCIDGGSKDYYARSRINDCPKLPQISQQQQQYCSPVRQNEFSPINNSLVGPNNHAVTNRQWGNSNAIDDPKFTIKNSQNPSNWSSTLVDYFDDDKFDFQSSSQFNNNINLNGNMNNAIHNNYNNSITNNNNNNNNSSIYNSRNLSSNQNNAQPLPTYSSNDRIKSFYENALKSSLYSSKNIIQSTSYPTMKPNSVTKQPPQLSQYSCQPQLFSPLLHSGNQHYSDNESEEILDKCMKRILQENGQQDNSYFHDHQMTEISEPKLYNLCAFNQLDNLGFQQSDIFPPCPTKNRSRLGSFKLHDEENEISNKKYQNLRKASIDDHEFKKKFKQADGGCSIFSSNKNSPNIHSLN